ncbi:IclR family transcriptional regulator [Prosthecomicrobium sp. N25]|uniref:IclR family transcriptional regulator n=1 Tax=Prosthecomicrobium sp. N25 TaxID=3129254 RepID=UPI0030781ACD
MSTAEPSSPARDRPSGPAGLEPKHTIPAIDRMMDVLGVLERREAGASITALAAELAVPRTTVYRILNTLQAHDMVQRDPGGSYRLGRRILRLAAHVSPAAVDVDLAAVAQPFLDRLSADLGASVKLSVIDHEGVYVLAVAQGRREYALTVAPGQRMPIHAGAASKLLLAHLPPDQQAWWLSRPLQAFTARSITDPKRLRAELARIIRQGWAQDRGEHAPSIHAYAAPVVGREGRVVAALSVPFLLGTAPDRMEQMRLAAIATARAISDTIAS